MCRTNFDEISQSATDWDIATAVFGKQTTAIFKFYVYVGFAFDSSLSFGLPNFTRIGPSVTWVMPTCRFKYFQSSASKSLSRQNLFCAFLSECRHQTQHGKYIATKDVNRTERSELESSLLKESYLTRTPMHENWETWTSCPGTWDLFPDVNVKAPC